MTTLGRFYSARGLVGDKPRFAGVRGVSNAQQTEAVVTQPSAQVAPQPKIRINSADKAQLMTLPGIGEKTAQQIIDHRPYTDFKQLQSKSKITRLSAEDWAEIKLLVTY